MPDFEVVWSGAMRDTTLVGDYDRLPDPVATWASRFIGGPESELATPPGRRARRQRAVWHLHGRILPHLCACGCHGTITTRATYLPGHTTFNGGQRPKRQG